MCDVSGTLHSIGMLENVRECGEFEAENCKV